MLFWGQFESLEIEELYGIYTVACTLFLISASFPGVRP
jgi:hypothetical protein